MTFPRTRRTQLMRLTAAHEEAFLSAVAESAELHEKWATPPREPEAFHSFLARRSESFEMLLATRRSDGALVGVFNLSQIARGLFCSAYLGYYGFAATTRQGYMQEAMSLLIHYAFVVLELHRFEANIRPENVASIRLVRRCGFEREGYSPNYLFLDGAWRDHERWAIRREIWSPSADVEMAEVSETVASGANQS